MICRTTGTALLLKGLRTDNDANSSKALSRISLISSNPALFSECERPTPSTTAAWNAWKLPKPLVYHLYDVNSGDSCSVWNIDNDALADSMHLARDAQVSAVISP